MTDQSAQKGLTIIYIGNGKGKTTAAVGLAVRAVGAGLKVAFTQFMKGEWPSGELNVLEELHEVELNIFGKGFVGIQGDDKAIAEHKAEAEKAYEFALAQVKSGKYDLVVLDELISAIEEKVLTEEQVLALIEAKANNVSICLTGHEKIDSLIEKADLVSEMKMVKHPYYKGMMAKKGIDY